MMQKPESVAREPARISNVRGPTVATQSGRSIAPVSVRIQTPRRVTFDTNAHRLAHREATHDIELRRTQHVEELLNDKREFLHV